MSEPAFSSVHVPVKGSDNTLVLCAQLAAQALIEPECLPGLSERAKTYYVRLLRLLVCMTWANGHNSDEVWQTVVEYVDGAEFRDLEKAMGLKPPAPPAGNTAEAEAAASKDGSGKRKNPYELTAEAGAVASKDAAVGSGCVGSTMLGPSLKQQRMDGSAPLMSQECSQAAPAHENSVPRAGRPVWLAPVLWPAGDSAPPQAVLPTAVSVPASASSGKQAIEFWKDFDCEHSIMERFQVSGHCFGYMMFLDRTCYS